MESMVAEQKSLDDRLRSLKIDRGPTPTKAPGNKAPKKLMLGISVLIAVAAAAYLFLSSSPKPVSASEVKTETGAASEGQTVLTVSGYVVAHHRIEVGAKVMGRVKWIGVEKGDAVKEGQVLVRLEDDEYRAQVNQAKANLASAQARLDQLRAGSRPQEKMRDKAAVNQAEANVKSAEADYERIEKLYKQGVLTKADYDKALATRDTARAVLESAKQSSSMTDVGPRVEEINAGTATVNQMKAALDYAETQLAATEIKAPVSGTVLQRIVERGGMVAPTAFGDSGSHTSVVSLADLDDLQIELDISQADFARLKLNQRAEIIPEAFSNLKYTGYIAEIAPEANRAKATVQIKVKVDKPDAQLRPEMNARVNFLSDAPSGDAKTASSRVLVPQGAVVHKNDSDFVFVIKRGKVEQRVIRKGDSSGEYFVVLEGLSGGESVVTTGADKLRDGDRVSVGGR